MVIGATCLSILRWGLGGWAKHRQGFHNWGGRGTSPAVCTINFRGMTNSGAREVGMGCLQEGTCVREQLCSGECGKWRREEAGDITYEFTVYLALGGQFRMWEVSSQRLCTFQTGWCVHFEGHFKPTENMGKHSIWWFWVFLSWQECMEGDRLRKREQQVQDFTFHSCWNKFHVFLQLEFNADCTV